MIDLNDTVSLKDKLLPLLDSLPMINSLILADTDGRECFMLKTASSWMVRTAVTYNTDMRVRIDRLDKNGVIVETKQAQRAFDPRKRAWFAGALQEEIPVDIFWTEPYRFKTKAKLGITASIRWRNSQSESIINVAAMDILLDTLHQFMAGLLVTPDSQIVL